MTHKALLNPENLESFRSLQGPEDPHFVKDFFETFLAPLPEHLKKIQSALDQKNFNQLARSAHAIKSSCLNVGADPLVKLCAKIEKQAKEEQIDGLEEDIKQIDLLLDQLKSEIFKLPEFSD